MIAVNANARAHHLSILAHNHTQFSCVQLDELIADGRWSENAQIGEQQSEILWRRVVGLWILNVTIRKIAIR